MTNPFDGQALADLGRFIQAQREIAQVSVRSLARAADVSDSYVSQLEKGKEMAASLPSAQVLTDLAKGLNLSPDVLIRMATWLPNALAGDDKDAVVNAISKDKRLKESQRKALIQLYKSMVEED
ncbi:helix-turn-helix domain-containing protein [Gordonia sp. (in: high G+C Gram-positive bacteria)]|uniref:helix-turn-helix domain-containing protein n=1 Tax=Gordonia sp. (in: high G+C Gram-positive bacteria) TaxID=84139 RepID=UPI001D6DA778|nr:helix-turn-helix transcriptional regulator [Gordonia sp. (in: high G+C Gram-positive bacteria)]MCB1297212.1 helix-turn-helix domain-containing protein [Gordonia sp. (in: high G+C Gram-positive bacteria)]HMS73786.1 helix-turn-helix transcriptional regulator [Gordonia sp. (in: high G+C Gram-positive bacteria)]HQV16929.1 helix-turn-helix transcriptional regulator [Gordonia sp. (in: high G+C Gram-positive bacteria)]